MPKLTIDNTTQSKLTAFADAFLQMGGVGVQTAQQFMAQHHIIPEEIPVRMGPGVSVSYAIWEDVRDLISSRFVSGTSVTRLAGVLRGVGMSEEGARLSARLTLGRMRRRVRQLRVG